MNLRKLALIPVALGLIAVLFAILCFYGSREPPNPCENFVAKSQWDVCFVPGESYEEKRERTLAFVLGSLSLGGAVLLFAVGGVTFMLARK